MAYIYAQIDDSGLCIGESRLSGAVDMPHMIPVADDDNPIGKRWTGSGWVDVPVEPQSLVPQRVTMRQARLALDDAGVLGAIDAAIAALPQPHRRRAEIEWEYSQDVQRHNGFVSQLAPALGLSDAQIDALFVAAAQL